MHGRVIVTGAQGLLGRHVVAALLAAGVDAVLGLGRSARRDDVYTHTVEWLDARLPARVPVPLQACLGDARYSYESVDVAVEDEVAEVARRFEPDAVVHTAAALRDSSWPALVRSNLEGTYGLLQGLTRAGAPRVVLTSSGSVYGGGAGALPFAEGGRLEPVELYGASKRAAEDIARILAAQHGLSITQARVFNLVGPGLQDLHLPAVLAARVAAIARGRRDPVLRLGRLDATRDFVDVRDAAEALVLLTANREAPAVVNVGSGRETPVRAVLDMFLAHPGVPDVRVEILGDRRADVTRACADIRQLRALGHVEHHPLAETLGSMLDYFDLFPAR